MTRRVRNPVPKIPGRIFSVLFLLASFFFLSLSAPAGALTEVEVNPVPSPDGAVLLIVDGLSAPFIYPELTPRALDGSPLEKALVETLPEIAGESARVLDIRAPQTFTEGGHSTLATGNRKADSELVSFRDASIFDAAHKNGYLCLGVMERGDSWAVCAEHDAILRDKNNSVTKMKITLEEYEHSPDNVNVPPGLVKLMNEAAARAPGYTTSKETRDRYSGYNRWGIETTCEVVEYMAENCPGQKYLLTVNVGAVDSSGHRRKNYGYIDCIESLDADLPPLYALCKKQNLAFILTADHGMAFPTPESNGGHQADKYTVSDEAQMVPLIVHAPGVETGVLGGKYGQEDIAPTLLSLLNIPERPRFSDGEVIFEKDYANLKVILQETGSVKLLDGGSGSGSGNWKELASSGADDEFLFLGLEPGRNYKLVVSGGGAAIEKEVFLEDDTILDLAVMVPEASQGREPTGNGAVPSSQAPVSGLGFKRFVGYLLIGLINLGGLLIIARILKGNEE